MSAISVLALALGMWRVCPTCHGGGKALGADGSFKTCPRCGGKGEV